MTTPQGSDTFYGSIPVFRGFGSLMDPALYSPLPDDWTIGVADIVESTRAIAEARYKAVNMAGAAVIAAVTNALDGRGFPFVVGGDAPSFAVSPDEFGRARGGGRPGGVPKASGGVLRAGGARAGGGAPGAAGRPAAAMAAGRCRIRGARGAGRTTVEAARFRVRPHAVLLCSHALWHQRRRLRAENLCAAGGGEFRLPQIRRRIAHDRRLHAGTGECADAAARRGCPRGDCAIWPAPAGRRDDDLLYAFGAAQRSRAFHRRRAWRLRLGGDGVEGDAGLNCLADQNSARRSRPVFAAAERANAAFDPQDVRTRHRNVAGIAVAIIGVVDLAGPFVRT